MEIRTVGAGAFAQAIANRALKARHKVKLSNRWGRASLREIVNRLGSGATTATKETAACEVVLLAVPWDNVPEPLSSLPKWKNQLESKLKKTATFGKTVLSPAANILCCGHRRSPQAQVEK
jgi:predicted dinucleotide-binding enzyme